MTLLGPQLHDLTLKDVQRFVDAAKVEGLLWEAKGEGVHPGSICKAVCAFANGRETGYLLLGAEQHGDGWELSGIDVPGGEAPAWVSQVINPALRPVPDVDVKQLMVAVGKQLVVVEIRPVAVPPCINRGMVVERVSGRTIPVESPARLSELYRRGEAEQIRAENAANNWAVELLYDESVSGHSEDPDGPRFTVAINATGNPPDISSRLFSQQFERRLRDTVAENLSRITDPQPLGPQYRQWQEQDNCWLEIEEQIAAQRTQYWHVRAVWDGTAVVRHQMPEGERLPPEQLFEYAIKPAWITAAKLVVAVSGYGPAHMVLMVETGKKLQRSTVAEPEREQYRIQRRLPQPEPTEEAFASVLRELRRAFGQRVYEDSA